MRKISRKHKSTIVSIFLKAIQSGQRDGSPADGNFLADHTHDLERKSLRMNAGQASNFIKREMLNFNYGDMCVVVEKKNKNNGGNVYKTVDLDA